MTVKEDHGVRYELTEVCKKCLCSRCIRMSSWCPCANDCPKTVPNTSCKDYMDSIK